MSYSLGQFTQQVEDSNDSRYMFPVTSTWTATQMITQTTINNSGSITSQYDECIVGDSGLVANQSYFFHAKVRQQANTQVYNIYLTTNKKQDNNIQNKQFLKTVTIAGSVKDQWLDIEFIFTPFSEQFNTILFVLNRTSRESVTPEIIYEELSSLKSYKITKPWLKLGIQAQPGLMFCLNGEEIHVGKTGVYECRNGEVSINFFSIITPGEDTEENLETAKKAISAQLADNGSGIGGYCLFNKTKNRTNSIVIVNYMYNN